MYIQQFREVTKVNPVIKNFIGRIWICLLFDIRTIFLKQFQWPLQYIPRNMHTVFALLCFVVVIHWLIFPYPPGLLHWHCGNLTIAPVPAKQPWWIWMNTSCEFIMNDCITTTKQSTTKPCAYFFGYTVFKSKQAHYYYPDYQERWFWAQWLTILRSEMLSAFLYTMPLFPVDYDLRGLLMSYMPKIWQMMISYAFPFQLLSCDGPLETIPVIHGNILLPECFWGR